MSGTGPDDRDSPWSSDEKRIDSSGESDDEQVSESYSVRFRRADRPGAMITRTVYAVAPGDNRDGPFLVRVESQWLVCSDPNDPGGTELWSDSFKQDETGSYETLAQAEATARNMASTMLYDTGSLTWDGLPQWGSNNS